MDFKNIVLEQAQAIGVSLTDEQAEKCLAYMLDEMNIPLMVKEEIALYLKTRSYDFVSSESIAFLKMFSNGMNAYIFAVSEENDNN